MDTAQWPQEIVVKPMEEIVPSSACLKAASSSASLERKVRPQKDQALNCPRCNSTKTKFCYYNNYSLSQPRYFCKTCRRYWTAGGSLRNIPVGGGSRKNKRSSSSSVSSKKLPDLVVPPLPISQPTQNPKIIHEGQDLNLGFPSANDFKTITELIQVPNFDATNNNNKENMPSSTSSTSSQLSALELLTSGITSRSGFNSFMPLPIGDPNTVYSSGGFPLPDHHLKPSLNFSLDGFGNNGFGSLQSVQETSGGRLLFPFEDLKQQVSTTSTATHVQQNKDHQHTDSTGYWNGVLGGGTW